MTKDERLAKLRRNAAGQVVRVGKKESRKSFKEIVAKPVFTTPVDLSEVLEVRGKKYFQRV